MKNPNGYGTVKKLSGKRRRPFQVLITTGWDEEGNQLRKILGSFATRQEALQCLAAYHNKPEEFNQKISLEDLYVKWHQDKFYGDYNESTEKNYSKAFNRAKDLHSRIFCELKLEELQRYMDSLPTANQADRFKTLMFQLSEWAVERDYATKNYAKSLKVKQPKEKKAPRTVFDKKDKEKIFNLDSPAAKICKVLLYTGCRISELLDLRREDCHPEEKYFFIRKSKTDNGIRAVPIHDCILPIVEEYFNLGNEYVFCNNHGGHMTYYNWSYNYWTPMMEDLHIKGKYSSHFTRHDFISSAVQAGIDLTALRKIVGHSSLESLTERVYTHLDIEFLRQEINKIPSQ